MHNLLVFLATSDPSPGGELREGLDPEAVTPGTLGFLATLFVVVATFFLIRDMAKRVRRVRYRQQVQEEAAQAEEAAAEGSGQSRQARQSDAADSRPDRSSDESQNTTEENDGGTPAAGHREPDSRDPNRRK